MPDFLKLFDNSGRKPRGVQTEFLTWLAANWRHKVFVGSLPVGSGKSAIARAIQLMTGGNVITPSNILIDQYTAEYPTAGALKGKTHYSCRKFNNVMTCQEWCDGNDQKPCGGCPYTTAKEDALTQPTFFNPMSLFYLTKHPRYSVPDVLIVDEAHQLVSMLQMLATVRIRRSAYMFSANVVNERNLVQWLHVELDKLYKLRAVYSDTACKAQDRVDRLKHIIKEIAFLATTYECFMADPQNYVAWIDDGTYRGRPDKFLNLKPLSVPATLRRAILASRKLILMSGTLFAPDIRELVGDDDYVSMDLASPIPAANRAVLYRPAPFKINATTDPRQLVNYIEGLIRAHPGLNTIIHVSYATSARLRPHFTIPILYNDAENKNDKVAEFKADGGVFLAAGCAEGLDLRDNWCRLNIIPQLLFPNLGDPVVVKRRGLSDGATWYALEAMKSVIQQAGRSTRGERDWSTTIICDSNFAWTYSATKHHLPKSFKEAIKWGAG